MTVKYVYLLQLLVTFIFNYAENLLTLNNVYTDASLLTKVTQNSVGVVLGKKKAMKCFLHKLNVRYDPFLNLNPEL